MSISLERKDANINNSLTSSWGTESKESVLEIEEKGGSQVII